MRKAAATPRLFVWAVGKDAALPSPPRLLVRRRRLTFFPMKSTLKVTSKGQVTFRKDLLRELGVQPGDKLTVEVVGPGKAEIRAARSGERFGGFIGCLENPEGIHLTIEEMNEVIADSWAGGRGPWTPKR